MKTKILVTIALIWGSSICVQAQIRHAKGIKAVEANFIKTERGQGFSLGFSMFLKSTLYAKGTIFNENYQDKSGSQKFTSTGADFTAHKTLLDIKNLIFLNAVGGATIFMDQSTTNETYQIKKTLKYGLLGGVEIEGYIRDNIVLIINGNYRYVLGGEKLENEKYFGTWRTLTSIGIKYSF